MNNGATKTAKPKGDGVIKKPGGGSKKTIDEATKTRAQMNKLRVYVAVTLGCGQPAAELEDAVPAGLAKSYPFIMDHVEKMTDYEVYLEASKLLILAERRMEQAAELVDSLAFAASKHDE
jgi:hypothetical protein